MVYYILKKCNYSQIILTFSDFVQVFPAARRTGCFYHFSQSHWRYFQQHMSADTINRYSQDADFATICRFLPSLAFVPEQDVVAAFDVVVEHLDQNYPELLELCDYFETTYIGRLNRNGVRRHPRFSIASWNMFDRVRNNLARTNNAVEAWHRGLGATLEVNNPTIWKFIDAMRTKFRVQEREIEALIAGNAPHRRRPQWQRLDQRLHTICDRYLGLENILEHLRAISYNFQY